MQISCCSLHKKMRDFIYPSSKDGNLECSEDNVISALKDESDWLGRDQFFHFKVSTKNTVSMAQCPSCFILFLLFQHSLE